MVGYAITEISTKPEWLSALLTAKFFVECSIHMDTKKNENNVFCIDCSAGICQHCMPKHRSHNLLQVRRYVYHNVIRLQDIQKFVECSYVQTYIINSARVVFLKQRPQSKPAKGFSNTCRNCERSLQESYRYCCISCKVESAPSKLSLSRSTDMGAHSVGHHCLRLCLNSVTAAARSSTSTAALSKATRVNRSRNTKRRKGVPHRSPIY